MAPRLLDLGLLDLGSGRFRLPDGLQPGPGIDGRNIMLDARAAVAANTATPEQLNMVERVGAGH